MLAAQHRLCSVLLCDIRSHHPHAWQVITSVFVSLVTGFIFLALWVFFRKPLRGIYEKRVRHTL